MRKWLRRTLLLAALLALLGLWWQAHRGPAIPAGSFVVFKLEGRYPESPPDGLLRRILLGGERSLIELLMDLRKAAADPRVRGIVVRLSSLEIGWGKAAEIRQALLEFRKSGKLSVAFLEQELTSSNMTHYIASAADRVYVSPASSAPLSGLAAQYFFLGGLWEKLDIELTVEKRAEYKTAGDVLAGREMTGPHREMANSLLDSLTQEFLQGIAVARSLPTERLRFLVEEEAPSSSEELLRAGLVDGSKHWEDLRQELGGSDARFIEEATYSHVPPERVGLQEGPSIAVVFGSGQIVAGESQRGPGGVLLGSDTLRKALEQAAESARVRAVVLRIDSPGGSALASDTIWRAVREVKKRKPVVVSMSDLAASGGYYSAVAAAKVLAQPTTLTGSIGVVLARPNIRGFLQRLGIQTETLTRGKFAALNDITTPVDEAGKARLAAEVERIYDLFIQRVSEGRGLPVGEIRAVARGRVWTGQQALERRLVDQLGGLFSAVDAAKELAGIETSAPVRLEFFPRAASWAEQLAEIFSSSAVASLPRQLRELSQAFPASEDSGPALLMPWQIHVR